MDKLQVKDLRLEFPSFKGTAKILRDVNFNLKEGETLGFAGESGCGKTMTALSIIRLIPHPGKITSGSVMLFDEDLLKKTDKEMIDIRGKKISLIYQEPLTALNPCFSVKWQIEEVLRLHFDLSKNERNEKIVDILNDIGLPDINKILNSYPHQLSGGMRQRIIIAMAIICNPEIMIADEPTTALDVTIQAEILSLIEKIQEERKKLSVIFISHDINLLAERCDRIMIMYMGEIVEIANTSELLNNPKHPYSIGLIGSTPRVSLKRRDFTFIKGDLPDTYEELPGCLFYSRCKFKDKKCLEKKPELVNVNGLDNEHLVRCFKKV
jgi:peptide/nickel transport system ATP-binding protein/oligopeptide transport system ATP-binding protein